MASPESAALDAQRRDSAGLGPAPRAGILVARTETLSRDNLDADDSELAAARTSAQALANLFPTVRVNSPLEDVIQVSNVDIADVITARALSIFDDDLNPDPELVIPTRVARRVVTRSMTAANRMPLKRSLGPRLSHSDAQLAEDPAPKRQPKRQRTSRAMKPTEPVDRTPNRQRKSQTTKALVIPKWTFQHRVHAEPLVDVSDLPSCSPGGPSPSPSPGRPTGEVLLRPPPPPSSPARSSSPLNDASFSQTAPSSPPTVSELPARLGRTSKRNAAKRRRDTAGRSASGSLPSPSTAAVSIPPRAPDSLPPATATTTLCSAPASFAVTSADSDFNFEFRPMSFDRIGPSLPKKPTRRRGRLPFIDASSAVPPPSPLPPTPSASSANTGIAVEDVTDVRTKRRGRHHHSQEYYNQRRRKYYATLVVESFTPARVVDASGDSYELAVERLNRSKPGWQGSVPRKPIRDVIAVWDTPRLAELLKGLYLVPYLGLNTVVCDMNGRAVVFRSTPVENHGHEDLVDLFTKECIDFSRNCPVPDRDRKLNSRGEHWACICGAHRQFAKKAYYTKFQTKYSDRIAALFRHGGPAFRLTAYLTALVRARFPAIAARMEANHRWHRQNTKDDAQPLEPLFGLFWNFCVNVPTPVSGVKRVFCRPHADQKNCAVLLCAVFVFWPKDTVGEDEWSWLVIWELGIILQCPRGSFILYPSALLFHFNVRIVKCKKGSQPTPENSEEIVLDGNAGRGSAVWFTQASMHSVTDERDPATGHLPNYDRLARECFPVIVPAAKLPEDASESCSEPSLLDEL